MRAEIASVLKQQLSPRRDRQQQRSQELRASSSVKDWVHRSRVRQVRQKVIVGSGIPWFDGDDHPFVPT
jgi:hypothetical protein